MKIIAPEKEIRWMGTSYEDILNFPATIRKEAGFQLGKIQAGLLPDNWKPFDDVGAGTKEIRLRDAAEFTALWLWRNLKMQFMCFIVFKRKRIPQPNRIKKSPLHVIKPLRQKGV